MLRHLVYKLFKPGPEQNRFTRLPCNQNSLLKSGKLSGRATLTQIVVAKQIQGRRLPSGPDATFGQPSGTDCDNRDSQGVTRRRGVVGSINSV